ncbi:MAG TPA: DoxX family protein [Pyrinomonadaceae bacterium]|nr:DoxX family protein [Pyrinomonadaceae bacterium]
MNIVLWIIQILLALLFLFSGITKLFPIIPMPPPPPDMWIPPMWFLKFIGLCEVLGALGLVLPGLLRRQQYLTVWAAIGLTIIMIGAVVVSVMGMGIAAGVTPLIVGILCAFVAWGRSKTHHHEY